MPAVSRDPSDPFSGCFDGCVEHVLEEAGHLVTPNYEDPVEEVVSAFAARLCDQGAGVAGREVEAGEGRGKVLATEWIGRTPHGVLQGFQHGALQLRRLT